MRLDSTQKYGPEPMNLRSKAEIFYMVVNVPHAFRLSVQLMSDIFYLII